MPLEQGKSKAAFQANVKTEAKTKPIKQALAIAYSLQRKSRAVGGPLPNPFRTVRHDMGNVTHPGGLLLSNVGGRTDHLPLNVKGGSYVVPADVVSGMGEGNTLKGGQILGSMFPRNGGGGFATGKGASIPGRKHGGAVPIMAAGGEYIITPEALKDKFGDAKKGAAVMDKFIVEHRKHIIKTMKKLPGPAAAYEKS